MGNIPNFLVVLSPGKDQPYPLHVAWDDDDYADDEDDDDDDDDDADDDADDDDADDAADDDYYYDYYDDDDDDADDVDDDDDDDDDEGVAQVLLLHRTHQESVARTELLPTLSPAPQLLVGESQSLPTEGPRRAAAARPAVARGGRRHNPTKPSVAPHSPPPPPPQLLCSIVLPLPSKRRTVACTAFTVVLVRHFEIHLPTDGARVGGVLQMGMWRTVALQRCPPPPPNQGDRVGEGGGADGAAGRVGDARGLHAVDAGMDGSPAPRPDHPPPQMHAPMDRELFDGQVKSARAGHILPGACVRWACLSVIPVHPRASTCIPVDDSPWRPDETQRNPIKNPRFHAPPGPPRRYSTTPGLRSLWRQKEIRYYKCIPLFVEDWAAGASRGLRVPVALTAGRWLGEKRQRDAQRITNWSGGGGPAPGTNNPRDRH
eukprot:gene10469-biopygen10827